jgi:Tfp pilus assembly protein PilF
VRLNKQTIFIFGLSAFLLTACQSVSDNTELHGAITATEKKLSYGILSYEEGDYPAGIVALQGVIDTDLASPQQKVKAYKYIAFIQCISGRESICRENFKRALEIDPGFTLDPAETGHPIWGPAFRNVKSKFSK